MDPSADMCLLFDSLKESIPKVPTIIDGDMVIGVQGDKYGIWFSDNDEFNFVENFEKISINSPSPVRFADPQRYQILQTVKDAFETEGFSQARDATNPFELIGRSIFMNRAAIKLANIDAVHHITNEFFTFDIKQSNTAFTFCVVAAGPGVFTQYLQYRFPSSVGYGMTLRHENLDWKTKALDMTRFTPFYGTDNTGNLYTNWDQFINYVHSQQPEGVDLVTADGGFDLEDNNDKKLLHRQEFLSSRLLLTQSLIGIGCCKIGGNFVVKVFDTVTNLSGQILFLLAKCFDQILIFKPVTSRPANAEKYVICINRKPDITRYFTLLANAARSYTDTIYLNSLFNNPLPQPYEVWLTNSNTENISHQLQSVQNILLFLKGQPPIIPQYDIDKFLIIWNLPDSPPRLKRKNDNKPLLPYETIIQVP